MLVIYNTMTLQKSPTHKKNQTNEEERREQFINIISHQLRTPLSIVRGYLEALESDDLGKLTDQQKEYVSEAGHINADMIDLVNRYVEAINTKAEKISLKKTAVNLNELLEVTVKHFHAYATAQNVEITCKTPKKAIILTTDKHLIISVIDTLMQNAMKYSVGSGTITLTLSEEEKGILITVDDEGVGIPTDQHDQIFKKFFRGKNIIHRSIAGNGLGLFVAKEYTEALGGTIDFTSQEGKGTSMRIHLPQK